MDEDGVGRTLLADQGGQRARVDARHGDDAAPLQPFVEMAAGAVVRWRGDVGAENGANRAGAHRRGQILDVLGVGPDIADMGKGEGDDLAGIGGVGQDFLVASQRGVEDDLGHGLAGGA